MRRIIREEEPPKPSTRLSDVGRTRAVDLGASRRREPAKLTAAGARRAGLDRDEGLEKDRDRRYETANGFARDVQRYLADEPVEACPPSAGYRLRKFVRRQPGPVVAAALLLLALVVGDRRHRLAGGAGRS